MASRIADSHRLYLSFLVGTRCAEDQTSFCLAILLARIKRRSASSPRRDSFAAASRSFLESPTRYLIRR